MKTKNQYKESVDQTEITKADLAGGKYVFANGCAYTKMLGVSPTGTESKTPENEVKVTYDLSGHGLLELVTEVAHYDNSVKARKSIREFKFFPKTLTVKTINGCRIQVADLPAEQQVDILFKAIPEGPARDAALAAYRKALA